MTMGVGSMVGSARCGEVSSARVQGRGKRRPGRPSRCRAPRRCSGRLLGTLTPDPAALDPVDAQDVLVADLLFDGLTRFSATTRRSSRTLASKWATEDGVAMDIRPGSGAEVLRRHTDHRLRRGGVADACRVPTRGEHRGEQVGDDRRGGRVHVGQRCDGVGAGRTDEWTVTIEAVATNYEFRRSSPIRRTGW